MAYIFPKLDVKDKKILYLLLQNARFSYSTIARNIGLTHENVNYRISRMLKNNIIKGFTINLFRSNTRFGYQYDVFLKLEKLDFKKREGIINTLTKHPNFLKVFECEGRWNLYISFDAKDLQILDEIQQYVKDICGDHLVEFKIYLVREYTFLKRLYFLDNIGEPEMVLNNSDKSAFKMLKQTQGNITQKCLKLDDNMDKYDLKILYALRDNCRIPYIELAKRLNLAPNTIKYRIENLIKRGILAYFTPIINYETLGFKRYFLFLDLRGDKNKKWALIKYLKNLPEAEYFIIYIGEWDYIFTFVAKEENFLRTLISTLFERHPNTINKYEWLWVTKQNKYITFQDNLENILFSG